MILTATVLEYFQTCPRKYYWSQVAGMFPKKKERYISIGNVFHEARKILFNETKESALFYVHDAYDKLFNEAFDEGIATAEVFEIDKTIVLSMLDNFPYDVKPVKVEEEFYFPLRAGSEHILAGKVDVLEELENRTWAVGDYKTKGDIKRIQDKELLRRNFQASFYFYCNRILGLRPVGEVRFYLVKRPGIRRNKGETHRKFLSRIEKEYRTKTAQYFDLVKTERDPTDLSFLSNLHKIIDAIDKCFRMDYWPTHDCNCQGLYGISCMYLPLCNKIELAEEWYDCHGKDHHPELEEYKKKEVPSGSEAGK